MDRFGYSLRVRHLEFDNEAISDGCRSVNEGIGGEVGLNFVEQKRFKIKKKSRVYEDSNFFEFYKIILFLFEKEAL